MPEQLKRRFGGLVFNGLPPRSDSLSLETLWDDHRTGVRFRFDNAFEGTAWIDWSEVGGNPEEKEWYPIFWSLATLLAQFALPNEIEAETPLSQNAALPLKALLRMLYDVRSFCDERPFVDSLRISAPALTDAVKPPPCIGDPRSVLVVLSGGFDSTFAALLMKEAGFNVYGLHFRVNRHVESSEEMAAMDVAAILGIPLRVVRVEFPDQERIGRFYSRSFGQFPFYNSVPHGRDFFLAIVSALIANRYRCGWLAFGHEKESRKKVLEYEGRLIYRHDIESEYGTRRTQEFLDASFGPGTSIFSPLAGLSIYRIRSIMLTHFPELARRVRSCFWGHRCERCLKCLSTYTMQRHLRRELVPFELNLFADADDEDMALFVNPDRPSEALGYGPQMHYAMVKIVDDGLVRQDDLWLHRFCERGLGQVRARWKAIEEICLNVSHPAEVPPQVQQVANSLL